jgi:dihydrofolate reductase
MSRIALVVAMARNGIIGRDGALPWRIPSELKRFKQITMGKPVIMGRKTWESLPRKPLPGRNNIVLTHQAEYAAEGAIVTVSPAEAVAAAGAADEITVIGGAQVYEAFLPLASRIYLTEIDLEVEGDTRFPSFDRSLWRETETSLQASEAHGTPSYRAAVLDRM